MSLQPIPNHTRDFGYDSIRSYSLSASRESENTDHDCNER